MDESTVKFLLFLFALGVLSEINERRIKRRQEKHDSQIIRLPVDHQLKWLRESRGLSYGDAARILKVPPMYYGFKEDGRFSRAPESWYDTLRALPIVRTGNDRL